MTRFARQVARGGMPNADDNLKHGRGFPMFLPPNSAPVLDFAYFSLGHPLATRAPPPIGRVPTRHPTLRPVFPAFAALAHRIDCSGNFSIVRWPDQIA